MVKGSLNWFVYCENNPIKYVDPTGGRFAHFSASRQDGFEVGWSHHTPQFLFGYANWYDKVAQAPFSIQGTRFDLGEGRVLHLWKGQYSPIGLGSGGEIGLYTTARKHPLSFLGVESCMRQDEVASDPDTGAGLGIISTAIQVFRKNDDALLAEGNEEKSFWTTVFDYAESSSEDDIYTKNIFNFESEDKATEFLDAVERSKGDAINYSHNDNESIDIRKNEDDPCQVIITWGKE